MPGLSALLRSLEGVLDGTPWNSGDNLGLRGACDLVRVAVTEPEFLCECAELELQLLRNKGDGPNLAPFLRVPSLRAGLAFGFWPPFVATGPHEHTAWTITAVIRNKLDVWVYDWAKSYDCGTLVESRIVNAVSPDVGYISSPTIHDVRNSTSSWSLALHVLSDHDGQRPADHPESIIGGVSETLGDDPYRSVDTARMRRAKAVQMAELLRGSVANPASFGAWFEEFMVGATSARINTLLRLGKAPAAPLRRLRRIHPDLRLSVDKTGPEVRLWAHSGHGAHPQIDVTAEFADPLLFIADQLEFDVESLPGNLTISERQALARALEDSCLFEALK
jgi:hypothetical protein